MEQKIDYKARAKKAHNTLKTRLGIEGYYAHMQGIAAKGGKAYVPKGLSMTRGKHAGKYHDRRQDG